MMAAMKRTLPLLLVWAAACRTAPSAPTDPVLRVGPTEDFEVTGRGDHAAWAAAEWVPLRKRQPDGHPYEARFKLLYSKTGLYVLMDGTDRKLTTTMTKPHAHLWEEDVYEAFFWTDERHPLYFEYEISPTNHELVLLIPNLDGKILGWIPWDYDGGRKIRKATAARGGPAEAGAAVTGWSGEFFVPYALLRPLANVPPKPGTRWRANFYRMDHDGGKRTQWEWAPVGPSFHEFRSFGTLVFE